MRVAYLCDGQGCESEWPACRLYPEGYARRCSHTTDPRHAVNGACDAPELEPERFVELEPGVFVEKVSDFLQCDNKMGESESE